MEFQYDSAWIASPEARPLSLSLPFNLDNLPLKGERIGFYFDNLLPDSEAIRRRLQSRFHTRDQDAFDLLEAIGRDCVGAVQLLPEGQAPENVFSIAAEPLDDGALEHLLRASVSSPLPGTAIEADDFRISLAGAQEKTALLWHEGRWCRPRGATPTTHIFKFPLGLVGHRQADMRTSVENEWLCTQILTAYGLTVAPCEIRRFGDQKVLVVERFDRRLHSSGAYWLRLPQEDFCQATGTPSSLKYESDGGPGLIPIARILQGSQARDEDLAALLRAQLLFWMLAATDGHAKNFSVGLLPGGRYRLTPLYDVLSAWPLVGSVPGKLDRRELKLAMALRGKNSHYRLADIQRRHFNATARLCGLGADMEPIIVDVLARTPAVIEQVETQLPQDFPEEVFAVVANGLMDSARRLESMAPV
jgi:serine/threonine-protein kinase HipA